MAESAGFAPGVVRLTPLGGLGEIGMNCMVVEQAGADGPERLIVDCGVTFPHGDNGVDVIHPRFDHLLDAPERITGIVLTHGHEDHIGGLPYLLRELRAEGVRPPVFGSAYALGLVRRRLEEHELPADLQEISPREPYSVGSFEVEHLSVTHSIPQSTSVALRTEAGTILHTGDFKLDPHPLDGVRTDERGFQELGDEGVALMMSDSTNVLKEGHTGSEKTVAAALDGVFAGARARVMIGLFASNLFRLDAVAHAARRHGRRLCLLGRSVRNHADLGRYLELLKWPSDLVVSPAIAAKLPREQVAYACGGTQGEFRGSLRRVASRTHHEARLDEGDLVVLSSRVIPGNERTVNDLVNALIAQGVDVKFRATHPEIHVSGHGHREEQRQMLEWVRPKRFVPLHGTRIHLERHAALARETGVGETLVVENGQVFELDGSGLRHAGEAVAGHVATARLMEIEDEVIRERRRLGRHGVIFVSLRGGDVQGIAMSGVPDPERARNVARRAGRWALTSPDRELARLKPAERVRRAVRWKVGDALGQRPVVIVEGDDES